MNDQGEKIIFLARELLNAGVPESVYSKKVTRVTMSLKTLCFTTILAAAGGGLVTHWTQESDRPLNRYERTEIQALVYYVAKVKSLDEEALRHDVEANIGVDNLEEISASKFSAARRYLQEKAQ